jgi:hypothetical protein
MPGAVTGDCGYGQVSRPGMQWFAPSSTNECAAYTAQLKCLNDGIAKCCGDNACAMQIDAWVWWVRNRRDEACANGE